MSVQATTWVWDHSQAENAGLLVMLAIADAANREGAASMQSVSTIAKMCRITERHVSRCIAKLLEMGELEKTGQSQRYGTTVYRLPRMGPDPQYPTPDLGDAPLTPGSPRQDVTPDIGEPGPLTSVSSTPDLGDTQPQRTPQTTNPTSSSGVEEPAVSSATADGKKLAEQATDMAFERWWEKAPRKVGKRAARKAYEKALKLVGADVLMAGLEAHLPYWEGKTQEHIPHPTTWLNEGRWEDRPEVPVEDKTDAPAEDPTAWMRRRPDGEV